MFRPIAKEGIGLHKGVHSRVTLEMGEPRSGVVLVLGDLEIRADCDFVESPSRLCTSLCKQGKSISTVEHIFSALNAYGETDVRISVDGPEIPILDGSALPWAEALEANGSKQTPHFVTVKNEVEVTVGNSEAKVIPLSFEAKPSIHVRLEYDDDRLKKQEASFSPTSSSFISEIAPARTFAFESDVERIREDGLGLGGTLDNALVIDRGGPLNRGGLRFTNEPARHKLLDALGDFLLLGGIPWARVELLRPGHSLMHMLVDKMRTKIGQETTPRGDSY